MSEFSMEELAPLLEKIVTKYTSNESTSVSYAAARQLMGSIIYSIKGAFKSDKNMLSGQKMTAEMAYSIGFQYRKEQIRQAKELFEEIKEGFLPISNRCYQDTILHGMPVFFLRYDLEFDGQNHILTLDYPLRGFANRQIAGRQGIDLILAYLKMFQKEQKFLAQFSVEAIEAVLKEYHEDYTELIINIHEIIVQNIDRCRELDEHPRLLASIHKSLKADTSRYQDGEPMEDELLRKFIEKMQQCRNTYDKIQLVKKHVCSLADLKELLKECFYEGEYNTVFQLLGKEEIEDLLSEIVEKYELDGEIESWEQELYKLNQI